MEVVRSSRTIIVAFSCAMLVLLLSLSGPFAQEAYASQRVKATGLSIANEGSPDAMTVQAKRNGWVNVGPSRYYYSNGVKATGLKRIDGKSYYFRADGKLRYGDFEMNSATFYLDRDGAILGMKLFGKYYYDTMKPMTSDDAYDFATLVQARSIIKNITEKGDSRKDKLWKAFVWVSQKGYAIHKTFDEDERNWPATYARYHFNDEGGDCHSDAAAFAYLAAALGYPADVCISPWDPAIETTHAWCMIDDEVYDPLFYEDPEHDGSFFGISLDDYVTHPVSYYRVPTYNSANADPNAKIPNLLMWSSYSGLKSINGNLYFFNAGSPLKSAWKKVNGHKYYFKKDGTAARAGSPKIGGWHYVFDGKGRLKTSKKGGLRIVKVGGTYYRVDKSGRAAPGLSADGKNYFFMSGRLLRGVEVANGRLFAASKSGVYNQKKTSALRKASRKGAPAAELYNALGAPESVAYSSNCEGKGYDGLWVYKSFIVTTIRPKGVKRIEKAAADAKAGKALPKKREYVCSVEAR